MLKLLSLASLFILVAACSHGPVTVVSGDSASQPRTESAGRAAGAGGSHAPGSTGLGAGTAGAESTAPMGSGR